MCRARFARQRQLPAALSPTFCQNTTGLQDLNRTELQQLSDERVEDANALLAASRWSGAYYLTGYALECALKSCVLAYVERTGIIFEDKKFAERCWTHDLGTLVKQADLITEPGLAIAANVQLGTNWLIAKDWSEATRYRLSTQQQAEELFDAITDSSDGVLQWVKNHW
jgi:hypothetical protein